MAGVGQANLHKKASPNGEVVLYIPKRDIIDRYTYLDSIDGIVVVPPGACFSRNMYVQVLLHFRYAAESEEFTKYSFKKTVCLHSTQLHPREELPELASLTKWQQSVVRRIGSVPGICPFTVQLPVGTPPSLQVQKPHGVYGEPCGLTYEIIGFLGTNEETEPEPRSSVRMGIRILQAPPPSPTAVLKGLWADEGMPVGPPATCVSRQFLLSPGRVQIELCLDKPALRSGEKLVLSVVISNTTNKTIKKIKCKLLQCSEMSFTPGTRRVAIATLDTQEGCPIFPGSSLQRSYTLFPNLGLIRLKEGLVFEAPLKGEPQQLAATTCFPNSNPRDGFAILVNYVAKIKLYLGPMQDIAAEVPFMLTHAPASPIPSHDDGKPKPKPKFVRLISMEHMLDKEDEPTDSFAFEMEQKPKPNMAQELSAQFQSLVSW